MKAILSKGEPNKVSYEEIYTPEILDGEALITDMIDLKDFSKGIELATKKDAMKIIVKVN